MGSVILCQISPVGNFNGLTNIIFILTWIGTCIHEYFDEFTN